MHALKTFGAVNRYILFSGPLKAQCSVSVVRPHFQGTSNTRISDPRLKKKALKSSKFLDVKLSGNVKFTERRVPVSDLCLCQFFYGLRGPVSDLCLFVCFVFDGLRGPVSDFCFFLWTTRAYFLSRDLLMLSPLNLSGRFSMYSRLTATSMKTSTHDHPLGTAGRNFLYFPN